MVSSVYWNWNTLVVPASGFAACCVMTQNIVAKISASLSNVFCGWGDFFCFVGILCLTFFFGFFFNLNFLIKKILLKFNSHI